MKKTDDDFNKDYYYTIAEVCKKYNINRAKVRKICAKGGVQLIEREEKYFNYGDEKATIITTTYIRKIEFLKAVVII